MIYVVLVRPQTCRNIHVFSAKSSALNLLTENKDAFFTSVQSVQSVHSIYLFGVLGEGVQSTE